MKRKCGTCRYFEDRGMAGSGTCLHPQRRELREVVLVRQTELACRNPYDQDLWSMSDNPVLSGPEGASSGGVIPDPDIMFDLPAAEQDVPLDQTDVAHSTDHERFTDRVTDVRVPGPVTSSFVRQERALAENSDAPGKGGERDSSMRSAVQSARWRREQERRDQNQRTLKKQIQAVESHMSSGEHTGQSVAKEGRLDPAFASPMPALTTVPKIAGLQDVPDEEFEPAVRSHHRVRKASVQDDRQAAYGTAARQAAQAPFRGGGNETQRMRSDAPEQGTEPLPTGDVRKLMDRREAQSRASVREEVTRFHAQSEGEPVVHIDGRVPSVDTGWRDKPALQQIEPAESLDPVDRVERLTALRRCCATCRDFRQVGNDDRGWCSNPYAFSERRMVQSDQLACRSSLGTWWMPNDDIWLERADTSHHGRPTPLLDASLKVQRPGEAGRDSHA